jgi:ACS family allantoate permease-like MFS transporter
MKGERMLPIIFAIVPTIAGAAMMVGLHGPKEKGALLFASWLIGKPHRFGGNGGYI